MLSRLKKKKGFQTGVCVAIMLVNAILVSNALSTLGNEESRSVFDVRVAEIPRVYYHWLGLSLVFGVASMWLIRYREPQSRWGARFFASLLLPAFLLLFTLNTKLFSWQSFLETVF
ncbi:MAG: hypothetical protein JJ866_04820 [Roseibium sp.]|uniref:hypothetical protein n=1 Tax=Roseibium sp. TaxID=1936156 RepID=UPI001B1F7912|nr:hypothetical protein [Roseibium sp.]MBO6510808.1 hypothetical protein [Roseibium sp.]MBO6891245.1 hypothetical protein [Roseibium sp.]MBO6931789.1 hypothetical protein [Roseibium sp.]